MNENNINKTGKYLLMATDKYSDGSRFCNFYGKPYMNMATRCPSIKHVKEYLNSYDEAIAVFNNYLTYDSGGIISPADIGYFEVIGYNESDKQWHIIEGDKSEGLSLKEYFNKLLNAVGGKSANLRLRLTKNLIDIR